MQPSIFLLLSFFLLFVGSGTTAAQKVAVDAQSAARYVLAHQKSNGAFGPAGMDYTDLAWTYPIVATLLVASAWITVTGLVLVMIVSIARVEARIGSVRRLEGPAIVSAIGALFIIIGLAQLRFWLERTLGIPQDFDFAAIEAAPTILVPVFDLFPMFGIV